MIKRSKYYSQRTPVLAQNCVSTQHPLATQVGINTLKKGGNAIDAALASAIALTILAPTMTSIGSDLFAIIWDGKKLHGLNASGKSPQHWSEEYFLNKYQQAMPMTGWDSVTVPGAIAGWASLSEKFGKLDFPELFEDAIMYAEKGAMVPPLISNVWNTYGPMLFSNNKEFSKLFLPGGKAPQAGSLFKSPAHANTFKKIAATRGQDFYKGELAEKIVNTAKLQDGKLCLADLENYQPTWVEPIAMDYNDYDVIELPPNTQGITVLIALGILKHTGIENYPVDSVDSLHIQIEAMKLAFADAVKYIADPNYMQIGCDELLSTDYLRKRADLISKEKAHKPDCGFPSEIGTVYLAAADDNGMMVSLIQSHYHVFGSGVTIPDTGIVMQNRGGCFSLVKDNANCVAGNKLPFHTIIPGFLMKDKKALMSFGVMGGHMQAQGHVQVMTRFCLYQQSPQDMIDAPRWFISPEGSIALEPTIDSNVKQALMTKGHDIIEVPELFFGGAQAIMRLENGYLASSDPRKDGQAAGF